MKRFRFFNIGATLWGRLFFTVIPVFILLWTIHGALDLREHRRLVMAEFMKRGAAMAENLAYSSELGVFAEDTQLLEASVRGLVRAPDVAYLVIYAQNGDVLSIRGDLVDKTQELARQLSERQASQVPRGLSSYSQEFQHGATRFIEFVAPIVSQTTESAETQLIGLPRLPANPAARPREQIIGTVRLGLSLEGVEAHLKALKTLWFAAALVVFGFAVFAIFAISKRITRPVKRLTEQAVRIASGDLDQTVPVESHDEIGQLAQTFDRMRHALKSNTEEKEQVLDELRELNQNLEDRIRERTAELEERTFELQSTLKDVRAMGEIGQAVTSSLRLEKVLNTIVARAVALAGGDAGVIYEYDDVERVFRASANYQLDEDLLGHITATPLRYGEGAVGQAVLRRVPVQIGDLAADGSIIPSQLRQTLVRSGYRSLLAVPLFVEQNSIGGLSVLRKAQGQFPKQVVQLLQTVANHSVVAIRNAQLYRELEEKTAQLEVASQHKSQFLANMSHELRTPLNAILGYTELIQDEIYGQVPQQIREVLERVERSGRHLLDLINDVLDLSKIEAGGATLSLTDYSMTEVINNGVHAVESLSADKNLPINVVIPSELPLGKGDERRITQVFLNLLGNAIKFTEHGEVNIEVSAENGAFLVSVSDTGPGISEADQEKIFEEFHQADNGSTRKKGGTGLGLAIAQRMIQLHGGSLWVESTLGNGATFRFSLPVRISTQVRNR